MRLRAGGGFLLDSRRCVPRGREKESSSSAFFRYFRM